MLFNSYLLLGFGKYQKLFKDTLAFFIITSDVILMKLLDFCLSFFSTTVVLVILQRPVSSGKKITSNQVQLHAFSYLMTEEQFFFH